MVKALVEIDDQTNKVLNMVKAKHQLRDKGQAIAFVVSKYKDNQKTPSLKYLTDSDKWILGEDIPDIDFAFSQMWLSCFVNEFASPGGRAYKKILAVYNGYNLLFYYGDKDSDAVGEHLVKKLLDNPTFFEKVNKEIPKCADKLRKFCETIPERGLDSLSNSELWSMFEKQDAIHTEYYQWGWIPVAADMFHNNLTEKLKQKLRSLGVKEDEVNSCLITLTQPREKSLIQIEKQEFLELALRIKKNKKHRELFMSLFKKFQEQSVAPLGYQTHTKEYEELLEQKVRELVTSIDPSLFSKIRKHYQKYFYVNHMWVGKASTFEYYLKELVKLIGTHADVETILAEDEKDMREGIAKREKLVKKLKLSEDVRKLFDGFGDFMVTKIYRRYAQIYAVYKMEFLQREIGQRFNLSEKEVRFMLPTEVKQMLLEQVVDREEIKERVKFCVYYAEKDNDVVFTGVRAKELAEEAKKIDLADISELKGQTGCLGKATGVVKQIFRPEDMSKMKKGDVLVSIATDPDIVSAMKKSAAIVTEQGGVTCHAAIVSRELGIPCVIGTKIATKVLHDGDLVEVDANKGIVRVLKRARDR